MTAVAAAAPAPGWATAWADALAELELSVAEAEQLLVAARRPEGVDPSVAAGLRPWTAPTHLGRLPAPLADRARALVDRQLRVARDLAEAAAHSRRQLRALDGMRATAEVSPVYLDTAG